MPAAATCVHSAFGSAERVVPTGRAPESYTLEVAASLASAA
jgi:hypothetical protein